MSVIKAKRHTAKSEFEQTFSLFYADSRRLLSKVPKRRQRFICPKIVWLNNSIYNDLMIIQINLFAKQEERKNEKLNRIKSALEKIEILEKAIMVYSNIMAMPFDKQCNWCNPLKKEINLLNGMLENDSDKSTSKITVLDWDKIHRFKAVDTMCVFHRYVHGKAVRAVNLFDNGDTALMIELIDEAFYNVIKANSLFPKNKDEFQDRINRIDKALQCLDEIQRPILSFFNVMKYSNRVMQEWSDLLNDEIKLLKGLLKSDKNRIRKLS